MLARTLRGSGLNLSGLGTLAREMAPLAWERYLREKRRAAVAAPLRPHPFHWDDTGLHAAWIGHSTVLLKVEGIFILTDPVFSSRAGLNVGPVTLGIKRLVAPALVSGEMPRPDIVLLSHAHMDHFDLPSLRLLESRGTQVVTAARTSDLLRARKFGAVHELAWDARVRLGEATVRAFEVKHWGTAT